LTKKLLGGLELNRIYQRDCLEGMAMIPDMSIDMVLCDLPYGTTQCKWDSIIPLDKLWEQYERIIKPNGVVVLTAQTPFDKVLGMSNIKMLKYEWVWQKEAGTGFLNAKKMPLKDHENILVFYDDLATIKGKSKRFTDLRDYFLNEKQVSGLTSKKISEVLGNGMGGHYFTNGVQWTLPTKNNYEKLQSTGFFRRPYNDLLSEYKQIEKEIGRIRYNPQMKEGEPYSGRYSSKNLGSQNYGNSKMDGIIEREYTGRYPKTVIRFDRDKEKLHPTQKPLALFEYLIRTYTDEGEVVLDNCIGSGTTAAAAARLNRNFIGFERESEYVRIANQRLEAIQDEMAERRLSE
jgi:DNA modification methylase